MNREVGTDELEDDVEDDLESTDESDDTIVMDDIGDIDSVGDTSVEINVEELVAKFESDHSDAAEHRKAVRRRLDELEEQRRIARELENTFNFNLDDDT